MKTNHRRGFKAKRHPDKSMQGWEATSLLADVYIGTRIGNDFCNGNRGMAKAVRGAKKFVRTRIRFHENTATRMMARDQEPDTDA